MEQMKNKIKISDILFWILITALLVLSIYSLFRGTLW